MKRSTKLPAKKENKWDAMGIAEDFERAASGLLSVKQAQGVIGNLMEAQGKALPGMSVRDGVKRWTGRQEKEVSLAAYRFYESSGRKWVEWLGARADAPLGSVTVQGLMEYRDAMAGRMSPAGVNHRMVAISMILRSAMVVEKLIAENPSQHIKHLKVDVNDGLPKVRREPFSLPQIKAVLAAADEEWKSMVIWGAYTGQRLAAIAMLRWTKWTFPAGK